VSSTQGDHLTIIKAHTFKDLTDMLLVLGSIWKPPVGSTGRNITVLAARSPGDGWALHFLDGTDAS
jgi:hypothetical protein